MTGNGVKYNPLCMRFNILSQNARHQKTTVLIVSVSSLRFFEQDNLFGIFYLSSLFFFLFENNIYLSYDMHIYSYDFLFCFFGNILDFFAMRLYTGLKKRKWSMEKTLPRCYPPSYAWSWEEDILPKKMYNEMKHEYLVKCIYIFLC